MITAYPLCFPAGYPRTSNPERSRFGDYHNKPSIARATDKILNELRMMGAAHDVIISTNLKLKNDGLPYSQQREPADCGVAVYFKINDSKEYTVIACDNYDKVGCNLYAIGKTIENIRGIDRWKCSEFLKRAFTGFQALPEANGKEMWWEVLGIKKESSHDEIKSAYRKLTLEHHPDRNNGDATEFHKIQKAYEEGSAA